MRRGMKIRRWGRFLIIRIKERWEGKKKDGWEEKKEIEVNEKKK